MTGLKISQPRKKLGEKNLAIKNRFKKAFFYKSKEKKPLSLPVNSKTS